MGNIETATKCSWLKRFSKFSISVIEDNYIEATIVGVLEKSYSQKFRNINRKTTVLESLFDKVAEKRLQHRRFPVHIANFYLFWKTSANVCFWLLFYYSNLFVFGCLFTIMKKNYDLLKLEIEIIEIRLIQDVWF